MEFIIENWPVYLIGVVAIGFCLYKFISGQKKLKVKRQAAADEDLETTEEEN